jgi:hypothetical protein
VKHRSRRLVKKLHKRWLERAIDLSQSSPWRKKLFESVNQEVFTISQGDVGLPQDLAAAVLKYRLEFSVRTAAPHEAEPWLSENGAIIFKFWATKYPSLQRFTGNNPLIV